MAVLNAFFDATDVFKKSDEARQAFAKDQLEGYKFLYGKTITIQNKVPPLFATFHWTQTRMSRSE